MTKTFITAAAAILMSAGSAMAGERTVTLTVDNMTCASCPYIVKKTLAAVPGVHDVKVSYQDRTALVTFEDSETDVTVLTAATARAGFPSRLAGG